MAQAVGEPIMPTMWVVVAILCGVIGYLLGRKYP